MPFGKEKRAMTNNGQIKSMLIPHISKLPKSKGIDAKKGVEKNRDPNEFKNLLKEHIAPSEREKGIHLSTHAARRLRERNLEVDSSEFFKLKSAFQKLKQKGGQDSLIITDKAAYIVDVPNRKVVTAIDKGSIVDNVFTKIDSTVMV